MTGQSLAKSVGTGWVLLVSALTLGIATPASAQHAAGASMRVSAEVLRPAVAPARLDTAVARAVRGSVEQPGRMQRIDDLPGGAQVVAQPRSESSPLRQVRVEYTAN